MTTCRYCVAHKSYVGIIVNLRTVVIASVFCIWDRFFSGPMVLQLVGILPLCYVRSQTSFVLYVHATLAKYYGTGISTLMENSAHAT